MYQIKCGDGYEIQVIGGSNSDRCRVEDENQNTAFTGTLDACEKWLTDRGIKVNVKGPMQDGRGPI